MINHNENELKAYSFISNFQNRYVLRDHAAVVIQRYYKYNMSFVKSKSASSVNSSGTKDRLIPVQKKPLRNQQDGTITLKLKLHSAIERFREYRQVWCADSDDLANGFSKMKESLEYIDIIKMSRMNRIK